MSIRVPKFVHNVPVRPVQSKVQWYEFEPANSDGFFELLLSLGRKPIKRIDIFRRTDLIQSTSPVDAPEFDLQKWHDMNINGTPMQPRPANQINNLERFYVHRGDVIYVRIEAELPAAFRFSLSRCHVLNLEQSIGTLVNVSNSTRLIVDQGQQPCNFSIDFGNILGTEFTLRENNSILLNVPIEAGANIAWTYDPGRDSRMRTIDLSTLVPYETNIRIVRHNG